MPKYRVTYSSIQLYDVEIEATSAEEAEAIASDMDGSEFETVICDDWEWHDTTELEDEHA